MTKNFKIAIAGLGTVGGGVVKALAARADELSRRAGRKLEIVGVSARDKSKARGFDVTGWTDDPLALAKSNADVVVELIGGEEGIARQLVETALANKKHVVTANKALLAKHGLKLAELAEKNGVTLKFEAAAAGGIPIVKALREGLITYRIDAVKGILNGTCNYILTEMESSGRSFAEVLKEAQAKGYAEADPTLDVGGGDTAHKLSLLASLAFGMAPDLGAVAVEGIAHITPEDIASRRSSAIASASGHAALGNESTRKCARHGARPLGAGHGSAPMACWWMQAGRFLLLLRRGHGRGLRPAR
jgi:homoserine dehydrogenase